MPKDVELLRMFQILQINGVDSTNTFVKDINKNEDGNKNSGSNSYKSNIERAINVYNREVKDE